MKLNYRRTFLVGLAFMAISAFWQMYDTVIPLMLRNIFGIKDTASGVIMALDNVLALFMLQFRFQLCGCGVHLPQQVGAFRRFLRVVEQLFARFLLILVF